MKAIASVLLIVLMATWAGIIIGVSLISTPVKFQAPSLTMPVGLDVGRYTFRVLTAIELWLIVAVIVLASVAQPRWATAASIGLVAAMILLQRYWLLPILDSRVTEILAGRAPSPSPHHQIYAAMEVLKAILLMAGAALEAKSRLVSDVR
jgi:hypothetical protein